MCITHRRLNVPTISIISCAVSFIMFFLICPTAHAASRTTKKQTARHLAGLAQKNHQSTSETNGGVVNINEATAEQLQLLPRVGPAIAQRILKKRSKRPFRRAIELLRVRGVGRKTYKQLKPYVTVKGKTTLQKKVHVIRLR